MIDELTDELYDDCLAGGMQLLSTNKCSRVNPVPPVSLYSALVQLLSPLMVNEDVTLVLHYNKNNINL